MNGFKNPPQSRFPPFFFVFAFLPPSVGTDPQPYGTDPQTYATDPHRLVNFLEGAPGDNAKMTKKINNLTEPLKRFGRLNHIYVFGSTCQGLQVYGQYHNSSLETF